MFTSSPRLFSVLKSVASSELVDPVPPTLLSVQVASMGEEKQAVSASTAARSKTATEIRFAVGDPEQDGAEECCHIDGLLEDDYLTADDIRILNWGLVERCKLFVPFRIYELRTDRVTRRFTAPEGVQVNWLDPVAVKEDYTIFIRDEKR